MRYLNDVIYQSIKILNALPVFYEKNVLVLQKLNYIVIAYQESTLSRIQTVQNA